MQTNKFSFAAAAAFVGLSFCLSAQAGQRTTDYIDNICMRGQAEGRYSVAFPGGTLAPAYLVCLDSNELALTWKMNSKGNEAITLINNALDGDQLTFSSFGLDDDDAKGITVHPTPAIRVEVSYSALNRGILEGNYKSTRTRLPKHFKATRESTFPNLLLSANHEHDYVSSIGTFLLERGKLGVTNAHFPIYLDLDIIGGIQRLALSDSEELNFTLFDGMSAVGAGNVIYVNSGIGDHEGIAMPLHHIRGRLTPKGEFEFYYFNTISGMSGPLRARPVTL